MASVFTLSADIRANTGQFEQSMRKAQSALGGLGTAADQAADSKKRLADGIAKVVSQALGATGSIGQLVSGIGAGGLAGAAIAAGAAVAGMAKLLADGIGEIHEAERATARLSAVFDGNSAALARMERLIESVGATPFFEADQIQSALAAAKMFDLTEQEISQLLPVVTDMAAVMGTDLESAVQKVGLALAGNTRGLKQWGIVIQEGADRQDILSTVLAKAGRFHDQSAALAGTHTGKVAELSKAWSDAAEKISGLALPAISAITQAQIGAITKAGQWADALKRVVDGFRGVAEAQSTVKGAPGRVFVGELEKGPMAGITGPEIILPGRAGELVKTFEPGAERTAVPKATAKERVEKILAEKVQRLRLSEAAEEGLGRQIAIMESAQKRLMADGLGKEGMKAARELGAELEVQRVRLATSRRRDAKEAAEAEEKFAAASETHFRDIAGFRGKVEDEFERQQERAAKKRLDEIEGESKLRLAAAEKEAEIRQRNEELIAGIITSVAKGRGIEGAGEALGGVAGTMIGGPIGGAFGGIFGGEAAKTLQALFTPPGERSKILDQFKPLESAAEAHQHAAKALEEAAQKVRESGMSLKEKLEARVGELALAGLTPKQATDIRNKQEQRAFLAEINKLAEASGLPAVSRPGGRSIANINAGEFGLAAESFPALGALPGLELPLTAFQRPEVQEQLSAALGPDMAPLGQLRRKRTVPIVPEPGVTPETLMELRDLLATLIELQRTTATRGTEANPIIIKPRRQADFAFVPRTALFRAVGAGVGRAIQTADHRPSSGHG